MDRPETVYLAPINEDLTRLTNTAPIRQMTSLTESRDIERVTAIFVERYGFTPPARFVAEFIDFVEALTDGQQ